MTQLCVVWIVVFVTCGIATLLRLQENPFAASLKHSLPSNRSESALQVDLGYDIYRGFLNATSNLSVWKGIRYAAPPVGALRWQAPLNPEVNRTVVLSASSFGPTCPQSMPAGAGVGSYGDEDCLYLNVYTPADANESLPVLVWIHGGGYGVGDGQANLDDLLKASPSRFIALGAFGFLSSNEVFERGALNVGLLDQGMALAWVQTYIPLFGGDPSHVTIGGFSAGGGSVLLQQLAYGGRQGDRLFSNGIAGSPYVPTLPLFNDSSPTRFYQAFVEAAGCSGLPQESGDTQASFDCLVSQDSTRLQNASIQVSASGAYGTWAFSPVIDENFVERRPVEQLDQQSINGNRLLTGHDAEEGFSFVNQNISTQDDLLAWMSFTLPFLSEDDIQQVLSFYPAADSPTNLSNTLFATSGDSGPNAIDQSSVGTGQQQRAYVIFAEYTIICPSYWMAEAFASPGRISYKYQNSVPIATHVSEEPAMLGMPAENDGPDLVRAYQNIWANFITSDDPSISDEIANGACSNSTAPNPASTWPPFGPDGWWQLNLNQTGNITAVSASGNVNLTEYIEPGLQNHFSFSNASSWEGGRGGRCDMWMRLREQRQV